MSFGLDENGFTKKRLTDIKADLEENLKAVFGVINTNPESVFGQLIGVFSEAGSKLWDLAELVYLSQYPVSAEGVQLDNAVDLTGITRLTATSSFGKVILEGTQGTVVPVGTQFKQVNTEEIFSLSDAVTLDTDALIKTVFSINDTGVSNTYTVIVNGDANSITNASTDENTLLALLKTELETNNPDYTVTHDTDNEQLTMYVTDETTPWSVQFGSNLTQDELWSQGEVDAVNTGALPMPINSITTIETPVSGLNSVDNLLEGTQGRALETDDELRVRRKQSLRVTGSASVPALEARIGQDVDGVTSVTVIENASDVTDSDGRPPHSFEAIVSGGDEDDIAETIWAVKGAGINTFSGNTPPIEKQVLDSQGNVQVIRFSRPIEKYVHINIEISLYSEESFPTGGEDAIKEALVEYGETLTAGQDLIRQRFFSPVYTVDGILNIESFEFAITAVDEAVVAKSTGTADSTSANKLIDSTATFDTDGVVKGMVVENTTDGTFSVVESVDSETQLTLANDIFISGENYAVGVFGPANIPIAANEIGNYATSRISVTTI